MCDPSAVWGCCLLHIISAETLFTHKGAFGYGAKSGWLSIVAANGPLSLVATEVTVVDCHINMSIKCGLCLDSKHRDIMHEGAEIVLPCTGDILARGSAMGELGEYLKAISLIS